MTNRSPVFRNSILLRNLPADVCGRLEQQVEHIDAPHGMDLYMPDEKIKNLYFPVSSMASVVATTDAGESVEIGIIGPEGIVAYEVFMGADSLPHRSMIQIKGEVLKIGRADAIAEFERGGPFQSRVLQFVQKMLMQVSQTTLCNRLHNVDRRLPRWLLMCHDRIDGDQLLITQEFIALMLGSSRVTVTQAASRLQEKGLIRYSRGRITIVDRKALEDAACSCYAIVRREYDRPYS